VGETQPKNAITELRVSKINFAITKEEVTPILDGEIFLSN